MRLSVIFYCDQVAARLNMTVDLLPTFIIEGNANFQLESMKIKMSTLPHSSSQILCALDWAPEIPPQPLHPTPLLAAGTSLSLMQAHSAFPLHGRQD